MWNYMVPILVFMIPITAILAGVAKRWIKLKERQLDVAAQHSAPGCSAAQSVMGVAPYSNRYAPTARSARLTAQIDGCVITTKSAPDCAALHPGYVRSSGLLAG